MQQLIDYMKGRLSDLEFLVKQGIIPGQLDNSELIECHGRIKELKRIISIAEQITY